MNQGAGRVPSSSVPKSQLTKVVGLVARHLRDTVLYGLSDLLLQTLEIHRRSETLMAPVSGR